MIEAAHERARILMQSVVGLAVRVEVSNGQRGEYGLHVKAALSGEGSLTLNGRGYRFLAWEDVARGADVAAVVDAAAREALAARGSRAAVIARPVTRGLVIR